MCRPTYNRLIRTGMYEEFHKVFTSEIRRVEKRRVIIRILGIQSPGVCLDEVLDEANRLLCLIAQHSAVKDKLVLV